MDNTLRASLIDTDKANHLDRTRTGRRVKMSLAAGLRHAALIGLFAAGLLALLIAGRGIGQLKAQSFNCRYARHPDERAICQDPELARLDEELASVYRRLLLRLPKQDGEQLYKEEDAFVILRSRCGAQRSCIEESYRQRLRQLKEELGERE